MDTAIAAFQNKMEIIARDPALKRTYDAYDKAESDWVTSMNTARKQGWQARQKEIDALQTSNVALQTSNDDLQAEIAELRRRLGG
ncbi:MAG: hypothetical protein LBR16_09195 [Treponema sp.]|nr:hypothetical protein [Treponema sp.]